MTRPRETVKPRKGGVTEITKKPKQESRPEKKEK
jgi:hypothetical protein